MKTIRRQSTITLLAFFLASLLLFAATTSEVHAQDSAFWSDDSAVDGTFDMLGPFDLIRRSCTTNSEYIQGMWTIFGSPCWWMDGLGVGSDYTPSLIQHLIGYFNVIALALASIFLMCTAFFGGGVNLATAKDNGLSLSRNLIASFFTILLLMPTPGAMGHYSAANHFVHQIAAIGLGGMDYLKDVAVDLLIDGTPLYKEAEVPANIVAHNKIMAMSLVCAVAIEKQHQSDVIAYYTKRDTGQREVIRKGESFTKAQGAENLELGNGSGDALCGRINLLPNIEKPGQNVNLKNRLKYSTEFNESASQVAQEQLSLAYLEHLDTLMEFADYLQHDEGASTLYSNVASAADMIVHNDSRTIAAYEVAYTMYGRLLGNFYESINQKARQVYGMMNENTAQFMEEYREQASIDNFPLFLYQNGDLNANAKALVDQNLPVPSEIPNWSCTVEESSGWLRRKNSQEILCEMMNEANDSRALVIRLHDQAVNGMKAGRLPSGNLISAINKSFNCDPGACSGEEASEGWKEIAKNYVLEGLESLGGADEHAPPIQRLQATGNGMANAAASMALIEIGLRIAEAATGKTIIGLFGGAAGAAVFGIIADAVYKMYFFFQASAVTLIVFVPGSVYLNYTFALITYAFTVGAVMISVPMVLVRSIVPVGVWEGARLDKLLLMLVALVIFPPGILIGHTLFVSLLPLAVSMVNNVITMLLSSSPGGAGDLIMLVTCLAWNIALIVRMVFWLSNLGSFLPDRCMALMGATFSFQADSENAASVISESQGAAQGMSTAMGHGAKSLMGGARNSANTSIARNSPSVGAGNINKE